MTLAKNRKAGYPTQADVRLFSMPDVSTSKNSHSPVYTSDYG